MEIWKGVVGHEDKYSVSNLGQVKHIKTGRILRTSPNTHGYYIIGIIKNKKQRTRTVHQLVAEAFLGHKPDGTMKLVVDHINGVKTDNRVENLQIITNQENIRKGKRCKGNGKYIENIAFWCESRKRWVCRFYFKGRSVWVGRFKEEHEAISAHENKINELNNLTIKE